MNRLFGKKKESVPAPSLSDASTGINSRIGQLDEKINGLETELRKYKEQLKKANGSAKVGIQRRALDTLKRKKMYEQQRDQLSAQCFTVDQTAFAIDSIKDTQTTVAAMKAATTSLKQETKKMNISEIEDFQDDLADMFDDVDEINDIMGRSYGNLDVDEAELEAELAGLESELEGDSFEVGQETPSYLQPVVQNFQTSLPQVPSSQVNPPNALPQVPPYPPLKQDEYGLPLQHHT